MVLSMANGNYLTPMLLVTGISFGNHWFNTGEFDLKILLEGAIATGILALLNNIDGMSGVTTGIAWVAFAGMTLGPVQHPSPVQNLLKIVNGK